MDVKQAVLQILDEVLGLRGRALKFSETTPLLGSVPELDSMAVVAIMNALEDRFDFAIADDEIDGMTFASVGSVILFVESKLAA